MKSVNTRTIKEQCKLNNFIESELKDCGIFRNAGQLTKYIENDLKEIFNYDEQSEVAGCNEQTHYGGSVSNFYELISNLTPTPLCKKIFSEDEILNMLKLTNDDLVLTVIRYDNLMQEWRFVFEIIDELPPKNVFTIDATMEIFTPSAKTLKVFGEMQYEDRTITKLSRKYN